MVKRKDGRYQEAITINGKRIFFYGKTKAEIMTKLTEFTKAKEKGAAFNAVAYEFWEFHEQTLAEQSKRPYAAALKRAISAFQGFPIKDIQPIDISRQIALFSANHADKTVRTQLMVYNLIFQYAVTHGYMPSNPAREIHVPKNLPKSKRSAASSEDAERIKASVDLPCGLFAYMAMYTGLRKGELLALTWQDIDLNKQTISVTKSLEHINDRPHIKPPKTETSIREVVIPDQLLTVLKKQKDRKGIIFKSASGGYIGSSVFHDLWARYCKASGVKCSPHQLRHLYATALFENGISVKTAQHMLGHAQYNTTMDVYTELRKKYAEKIKDKMHKINIV